MIRFILTLIVAAVLLTACALPPERPVTREELMQTRIYQTFVIVESPEQILALLNSYGEAVLLAKRNIPGKDYPVHVKLLATSEGIEISDYDR
ncbi:MAG: hypothetical protein IBX47_00345 [Desulfuromonadales bacterium]|nr:hypothetical protein [Desulfuromonadales bacterium]